MLTPEDLQAISNLMDKRLDVKLAPVNERLSRMEESLEETRSATNSLLEWAERVESEIGVRL